MSLGLIILFTFYFLPSVFAGKHIDRETQRGVGGLAARGAETFEGYA